MPLFSEVEFRAFDADGFKLSLFQLAQADFNQWTDTLTSNQGVVFVEWLEFIGANLAFMQNFQARQAFVPTVTEAKNLLKLAKQFDYQIPNNEAAITDVTISNEDGVPFTADVIIPKGTQLKTSGTGALIFETTEALTIPAGAMEADVPAANWETKVENDTADGTVDFKTRMSNGPYVANTIEVEIDLVDWVLVDNFLDSDGTDEHFRIEVDSDGIMTVIFGDGINGKVPAAGSAIVYTYKVGGGEDGNVPPGTITEIIGTFFDVNNSPVDLEVTNAAEAEGGVLREDMEVTKLRIPASLSAKDITLDYEDFETNIGSVAGVARVKPQTVNDNPDIPENTVIAVVLPDAVDTVSDALEAQILAKLEEDPTTLTLNVLIVDPHFVTIDIDVRDLELEEEDDDGTGDRATASITIINNVFNAGDSVTVNGVEFIQGVDFVVGAGIADTALSLANAIDGSVDPLLQDIEASFGGGGLVNLSARTNGVHGNEYTLTESDGVTNNFTLSGGTFLGGEDGTVQAAIRAAIDEFFGRENVDEEQKYTVGFGETVYRNTLIWLVKGVEGVDHFEMETPADNVDLDVNQFPKYTLKFTTS